MRISNDVIDRIYCNSAVRSRETRMAENHSHNYYEIFYVRKGNTRFFVDDRLFDLHEGDFMLVLPNLVHYNRYISQSTRINIYFRDVDMRRGNAYVLPDLKERFLTKTAMYHTQASHREKFESILDMMLTEDSVNDGNTELLLQLMFQELVILSTRYCTANTGYSNAISQEGDSSIQEAAHYISEHYYLPISLTELAEKSGLSPAYFSKRFHLITGMGMKEYLTYTRLRHAEDELVSTTHTIKEIAANTGFSDSNYFKDVFKKEFGISPRSYRKIRKTDFVDGAEQVF